LWFRSYYVSVSFYSWFVRESPVCPTSAPSGVSVVCCSSYPSCAGFNSVCSSSLLWNIKLPPCGSLLVERPPEFFFAVTVVWGVVLTPTIGVSCSSPIYSFLWVFPVFAGEFNMLGVPQMGPLVVLFFPHVLFPPMCVWLKKCSFYKLGVFSLFFPLLNCEVPRTFVPLCSRRVCLCNPPLMGVFHINLGVALWGLKVSRFGVPGFLVFSRVCQKYVCGAPPVIIFYI